jgi:Histidine kinase
MLSLTSPSVRTLKLACVDITLRKQAEEAARDLSGRLIHAQEAERMRLARDLHDDLSQSLALLSIELEMFGQRQPAERGEISGWGASAARVELDMKGSELRLAMPRLDGIEAAPITALATACSARVPHGPRRPRLCQGRIRCGRAGLCRKGAARFRSPACHKGRACRSPVHLADRAPR